MVKNSNKDKPNQPNKIQGFYKYYFMHYWEIKYKFLKYQIDNFEIQKQKLNEISGFNVIPNYEKNFLSMLKFDLHFMKFQIIESLFSFIFALENKDDNNLWFNLSFPRESSLRSFATYDKISELSDKKKINRFLKNKIEFGDKSIPYWRYLFFLKIDLFEKHKEVKIIEENIITLLYQLAKIFKDRGDYNAYKHSLRCYRSSLLILERPQGVDQYFHSGYAKDGMNYLAKKEKKNEKEDNIFINITFKAFSMEEDLYYIGKSIELLKNILNTRISLFYREKIENISYFEDINQKFQEVKDIISDSKNFTSRNSLFTEGLNAIEQGEFKKGIFFFEKVLQIDDSHSETKFQLGLCHFSLNNYDKAIFYFKVYVENGEAEHRKKAICNLALCYFKKNDIEKAQKKLNQYLKDNFGVEDQKTNIERYLLAEILLDLNQQYFIENRQNNFNYIKKAERLLKDTEKFEFSHPELWFRLAFIKDCMNRFQESNIIYKKIIEKCPDSLSAIVNLSKINLNDGLKGFIQFLFHLKKYNEIIDITKDINYSLDNVIILTNMALAFSGIKKKDKAFQIINNLMDLNKKDKNDNKLKSTLNNSIGDIYKMQEDWENAINFYQKALEGNQDLKDESIEIEGKIFECKEKIQCKK